METKYSEDSRYIRVTEKEADQLKSSGVAALFDCPCECKYESESSCVNCNEPNGFGGFFEAKENGEQSIILIISNEGYFVRAREDLVKSNDEIFVGFLENGKPPEFEEVFEVRQL